MESDRMKNGSSQERLGGWGRRAPVCVAGRGLRIRAGSLEDSAQGGWAETCMGPCGTTRVRAHCGPAQLTLLALHGL